MRRQYLLNTFFTDSNLIHFGIYLPQFVYLQEVIDNFTTSIVESNLCACYILCCAKHHISLGLNSSYFILTLVLSWYRTIYPAEGGVAQWLAGLDCNRGHLSDRSSKHNQRLSLFPCKTNKYPYCSVLIVSRNKIERDIVSTIASFTIKLKLIRINYPANLSWKKVCLHHTHVPPPYCVT